MARFLAVFFAVLLLLFLVELTAPAQRLVVVPWTSFLAHISGSVAGLMDSNVLSRGNVLQDVRSGRGV